MLHLVPELEMRDMDFLSGFEVLDGLVELLLTTHSVTGKFNAYQMVVRYAQIGLKSGNLAGSSAIEHRLAALQVVFYLRKTMASIAKEILRLV